ncbi:MAG: hypothetical protein AAGA03_14160 [Planctomycetota bacterium]
MSDPLPPDVGTTPSYPYSSPTAATNPVAGSAAAAQEGDGTGGVIPYKNPAALIAYYLGLFSLVPVLGLFLAIPAFVLGIIGLRNRSRNPAIKGSVHAWIGIVMGGLFTLIWGLVMIVMVGGIIAAIAEANP